MLNPTLLYTLIYLYASFFYLSYKINNFIRGRKHNQTIKEHATSLFDTLAPPFVHRHDVLEVKQWFVEREFINLVETDKANIDGFNICGTKNNL